MTPPLALVLESPVLRLSLKRFLGPGETEVVDRGNHAIVRLLGEESHVVRRMLLLAPMGFTGTEKGLLNVHPEARSVRLEILGRIAPEKEKKGYRPVVGGVQFLYSPFRDIPTIDSLPYARFSDEFCRTELKSWRCPFHATKRDGFGQYHSLESLTPQDWTAITVTKELHDRKPIVLEGITSGLTDAQRAAADRLVDRITTLGDGIFHEPETEALLSALPRVALADLSLALLSLPETGKHEACSSFAILLKLAKADPQWMAEKIRDAIRLQSAPYYYLQNLEGKVGRINLGRA